MCNSVAWARVVRSAAARRSVRRGRGRGAARRAARAAAAAARAVRPRGVRAAHRHASPAHALSQGWYRLGTIEVFKL